MDIPTGASPVARGGIRYRYHFFTPGNPLRSMDVALRVSSSDLAASMSAFITLTINFAGSLGFAATGDLANSIRKVLASSSAFEARSSCSSLR